MEILNYINGELCPSKNNEWLDNFNPATEEVIGKIAKSTSEDVRMAVEAAQKALPLWCSLSTVERASYLLMLSTKINENLNELALLETRDTGKPIHTSKNIDIPRSALNLKFFAEFSTGQTQEEFHAMDFKTLSIALLLELSVASLHGIYLFIYLPGKLPRHLFQVTLSLRNLQNLHRQQLLCSLAFARKLISPKEF